MMRINAAAGKLTRVLVSPKGERNHSNRSRVEGYSQPFKWKNPTGMSPGGA